MKIYIIQVPEKLQPSNQPFAYPAHNKDYGVEQDFLVWLTRNSDHVTSNPQEADWHYLPVYWTRWHMHHAFGEDKDALAELKREVDNVILDDKKTFTITQFDGGTLLDLGKTVIFTAARTINTGIDIPILCSPHKAPLLPISKKYAASFNGSFDTHAIRKEMHERFSKDPSILIGGSIPTPFYIRYIQGKQYNINTIASYISLCPRGTSCNSFRFFEAMQLGTAPMLIGDVDARPFSKFIPWNEISYFASTIDETEDILKKLDKKEALEKGKRAFKYWKNELYYQKWCKYVIMELNEITK